MCCFLQLAQLIQDNAAYLSALESLDNGKPATNVNTYNSTVLNGRFIPLKLILYLPLNLCVSYMNTMLCYIFTNLIV